MNLNLDDYFKNLHAEKAVQFKNHMYVNRPLNYIEDLKDSRKQYTLDRDSYEPIPRMGHHWMKEEFINSIGDQYKKIKQITLDNQLEDINYYKNKFKDLASKTLHKNTTNRLNIEHKIFKRKQLQASKLSNLATKLLNQNTKQNLNFEFNKYTKQKRAQKLSNLATKLLNQNTKQNLNFEFNKYTNQATKLSNLATKLLKTNNQQTAKQTLKDIKYNIYQQEMQQQPEKAEQQQELLYEQAYIPKPDFWQTNFQLDEEAQTDEQNYQKQFEYKQDLPDNEDLAFKTSPYKPTQHQNINEIKQYNQNYLNKKLAWNYNIELKKQIYNITYKLIKQIQYKNIIIQTYQPKQNYTIKNQKYNTSKQYQSSKYQKQETQAVSQIETAIHALNQQTLDRQYYKNYELQLRVNNINQVYILIEMLKENQIYSLKNKFQFQNNIIQMQLYAPNGIHILQILQIIYGIPGTLVIEKAKQYGQTHKYLLYYNIYKNIINTKKK